MKSEEKEKSGLFYFWKELAALVLAILVFGGGHFAGYHFSKESTDSGETSPSSLQSPKPITLVSDSANGKASEAFTGKLQGKQSQGKKPAPTKPEPMRLEDLPPGFLKDYRIAEDFVNRIPEMEQEILDAHPLLQQALAFEQDNPVKYDAEEARREKQIWEEWSEAETDANFKRTMRISIQRLDAYLELMDDPEMIPFLEAGLQSGQAKGLSETYYGMLHRDVGLSMVGVDRIDGEIMDWAEFREAFRQFVEQVKSVPENQFAVAPLSEELEASLQRSTLRNMKKQIVNSYRRHAVPDALIEEQWQLIRQMKRIGRRFGNRTPPEIWEIQQQLEASRIVSYKIGY